MNLTELKKRIAKRREIRIPWKDFTIIVSRPTEQQMLEWQTDAGIRSIDDYQNRATNLKLVREGLRFVSKWENVTESCFFDDELANGSEVKFDRELLEELIDRHKGLDVAVTNEIFQAYEKHLSTETDEKKS